ncbi:hypothetical protein LTR99_007914 [Exophiala xenobiotica]|nr:hypothetical protein LTR72_005278 [Exophiala xenobiotica]KAK5535574.1 hypothetical protein LTR23_008312 [Chaetothyriales sp. CCFEE 6169]KAK5236580.1 hypothetical protein LTR47_002531 [Exophiala xenobiotica]KAK5247673.1 hypothetical protein LTS06_007172 [Exophiala xenobiotica]KAK5273515.1 hypothetical protein LTR96_000115 [Exophiala xenobiotica]
MASPGHDFFSHVRSKLRHSRSNLLPSTSSSTSTPIPAKDNVKPWENLPVEYRPIQRAHMRRPSDYYYPYQTLPGPPPRPRTTSPTPTYRPQLRIDTGNGPYTKPKAYRRRSAQELYTTLPDRNSGVHHAQQAQDRRKSMSVEIAIALPPDHLDPPPPYSPPRPRPGRHEIYRTTSQPYQAYQEATAIRPYDPREYATGDASAQATYFARGTRRAMMEVPTIAAQPPTPVSPLNTLDEQYLALKRSGGSVTVDALLAHPMLH